THVVVTARVVPIAFERPNSMTAFLAPETWRRNPLRLALFASPAALLVVPAVAMRYTSEVDWSGFDFVFAAVLLFGSAGLAGLAGVVGLTAAFATMWLGCAALFASAAKGS